MLLIMMVIMLITRIVMIITLTSVTNLFKLTFCQIVAGIGIKEHFEVNVCPLSVNITHRLYNKIMVFFFPQRAHEYESDVTDVDLLYKGGMSLDPDSLKYRLSNHQHISVFWSCYTNFCMTIILWSIVNPLTTCFCMRCRCKSALSERALFRS